MTEDEARDKAQEAVEMGLIEEDQVEAYVQHLVEVHGKS